VYDRERERERKREREKNKKRKRRRRKGGRKEGKEENAEERRDWPVLMLGSEVGGWQAIKPHALREQGSSSAAPRERGWMLNWEKYSISFSGSLWISISSPGNHRSPEVLTSAKALQGHQAVLTML
jgi:hypothetical protein